MKEIQHIGIVAEDFDIRVKMFLVCGAFRSQFDSTVVELSWMRPRQGTYTPPRSVA